MSKLIETSEDEFDLATDRSNEQGQGILRPKLKASGIHLGISGIIFIILAYLITYHWYPYPYFTADGGWQGIRLVGLIDLVLGPFITLIVFNPKKSVREITFDLSLIALVQACALVWGIYTTYNERPVAVVHWDGQFYTITSKPLALQGVSVESLSQYSDETPALIHAYHPREFEALMQMKRLVEEKELAQIEQAQLYRPFRKNLDVIFKQQINIETVLSKNESMRKELDEFLKKHGGFTDSYVYMPLNARYHNAILIFSKQGHLLGALNAPYHSD